MDGLTQRGTVFGLISRRTNQRGQALVEFALTLPVFLLLVFGVFDFGRAVWAYSMVSEAARAGARAGMIAASKAPAAAAYNTVISAAILEIVPAAMAGFDSSQDDKSNTSIVTLFCTSSHTDTGCSSSSPGALPCSPTVSSPPNYYVSVTVTGKYQPVVGSFLGIPQSGITLKATSQRCLAS
jgi:Flp pilus assembly protein TadG